MLHPTTINATVTCGLYQSFTFEEFQSFFFNLATFEGREEGRGAGLHVVNWD